MKILLQFARGIEFYGFSTFLGRTLMLTFQIVQNPKRALWQDIQPCRRTLHKSNNTLQRNSAQTI
jgi:hypothetical protein